jgi:hypothetical protein
VSGADVDEAKMMQNQMTMGMGGGAAAPDMNKVTTPSPEQSGASVPHDRQAGMFVQCSAVQCSPLS